MRVCFFGDSFVNGTGDDDGAHPNRGGLCACRRCRGPLARLARLDQRAVVRLMPTEIRTAREDDYGVLAHRNPIVPLRLEASLGMWSEMGGAPPPPKASPSITQEPKSGDVAAFAQSTHGLG
jgi:hypothetical protein